MAPYLSAYVAPECDPLRAAPHVDIASIPCCSIAISRFHRQLQLPPLLHDEHSQQIRCAGRHWDMPPVRLGLSRRNSDRLSWKRSQSVSWNSPREYSGMFSKSYNSRHLRLPKHFQNSPPRYGWKHLFSQKWFRRGPLRAGHGIPSSTEGISEAWCEDSLGCLQIFCLP